MGIIVWKREMTHPHFHMGTVCYHTGIRHKWIPVTIRRSRYGSGDWDIPIWKWLITVSIWRLRSSGSLFPYGDHHVETGIERPHFHTGTIQSLTHFHKVILTIWEFRKKHHMRIIDHLVSPFPYGNRNSGKNHHMRIINHLVSPFPYGNPRMERGSETKKLHLGTPRYHKVFVTIWGLPICISTGQKGV